MTREERHIAVLNRLLENMDVYDSIQPTTERKKAIKAAIKALSQEPCDDAISRILKKMWNCRGKHTTSIDKVAMEQIIRDELSVTQKPIECDDAISRQAVLDGLKECMCEDWVKTLFATMVKQLPSVTQKSETEIWNGMHGQITAPKGTFKKIFEDAESEE